MTWSITDYVAWWGAIVAAGVLAWDIYKVKSAKPLLLLRTSTIIYPHHKLELEIANIGNKDTALTRVYANAGLGAESELDKERIVIPSGGHRTAASAEERFSLPYMLTPGAVWRGWIDPKHIYRIEDLGIIIVKVRDEHGNMVVRQEAPVPSQWRRPNNRLQSDAEAPPKK